MAKYTPSTVASGFNSTTELNNEFVTIADHLDNKVLYRNNPSGEPNQMLNDLDMNSNDILNADSAYVNSLYIDGILSSTTAYSGVNVTKAYGTVAALKAATDLIVGDLVMTQGYTTAGDGGHGVYRIVAAATGTDDGGSYHNLTGITGQAELIHNGRVNLLQFGGVGDGATDNASALQAAINEANRLVGMVIEIPTGNYFIASTITFKRGASLVGGQGDGNTLSLNRPIFRWSGAAAGTMFQTTAIGNNIAMTIIDNITFVGKVSGDQPAKVWHIQDRVDYGWSFLRCQFGFCTGDAITLDKGATNFYMYDFRMDDVGGYGIKATVNTFSFFGQFDKFTWAGSSTANASAGFLHLDGDTASNNVITQTAISNARLEINEDLDATLDAIIALGCTPAVTNYLQHYLTLSNLYIPAASAVTTTSLVKAVYAAGGPTNQIAVTATGVYPSSAKITQIAGTSTSGPVTSKQYPFYVFAPFTTGSPATGNLRIDLNTDVYLQKRIIENSTTFADGDTSPSVANGSSFRTANTGGTVITDFDDGVEDQIIMIQFEDGNTDLNGGNLLLAGATSWLTPAVDDVIVLKRTSAGKWREVTRSVN